MRFLVIGLGSIGQRHSRNLVGLGHEVSAWDVDATRLREMARTSSVTPLASLEDGLKNKPSASFICTPPASHVRLAREALYAGCHLFIEKPISNTSAEVEGLLREARQQERLVMVGCNLRFLPSLKRIKALLDEKQIGKVLSVRAEFGAYLPDWRPGRDYRDNYAVRAELGGGILLDAIHEFDYLTWLFGDAAEVFCVSDHLSDLAGDTEDLVEVTVRFRCGVLAQIHLDYVQRTYRRNLQIIGDGGTVVWDYPTHLVTVQSPTAKPVEENLSVNEDDRNRMYVDEVAHFVCCIEQRKTPPVDGHEALRSLHMVEAAKESARERTWVTL